MQGTVLVDVPFPDEAPLEQIYSDLLIGDVETVAEKLVGEILGNPPGPHMFFVQGRRYPAQGGDAGQLELMMNEVRPRVERAVGALTRNSAD